MVPNGVPKLEAKYVTRIKSMPSFYEARHRYLKILNFF
jgi:hypothetical protein